MSKEPLTWETIHIRLGDIVPNPRNPKHSNERTVERLNDSIDSLGGFQNFILDHDGVSAVDGNQRYNAWIDHKGEDFVVEAKKASRKLTDAEIRKIILYTGKGTHGDFDFEMLKEDFDIEELVELGGFDEKEFSDDWDSDIDDLGKVESSQELPPGRVIVTVPEEGVDHACEVIRDALRDAGFTDFNVSA